MNRKNVIIMKDSNSIILHKSQLNIVIYIAKKSAFIRMEIAKIKPTNYVYNKKQMIGKGSFG